jgi:hypothetical protein
LIFSQILVALDHLHSRSPPLVHGNLSPRTIYVTPDNSVRLSDFGLRRIVAPIGKILSDRSRVAPPEESTGQCDIRSDVWALGAILYHICTGLPLTRIRPIPRIPTDLNALILRMLNRDPSSRPTVAQIAAAPFLRGYFEWFLGGRAALRIPKIGGGNWNAVATPDEQWKNRERGCPPPKERALQSQLARRSEAIAPKIPARGPWVTNAVGAVTNAVGAVTTQRRTIARATTSARREKINGPGPSPASGPVRTGRRERVKEEEGPSWAWDLPTELRKPADAQEDAPPEGQQVTELGAFRGELRELVGRLPADRSHE